MDKLKRVLEEFRNMTVAGLAVVVLATLVGFIADLHSVFDWFADFRLAYVVCAIIPLLAWLRRDMRVVGVAAATIAVNLAVLAPWASRPMPDCEPEIVAISLNVFGEHGDPDKLVRAVTKSGAGLVFASEMTPEVRQRLSSIFPHHAWDPHAWRLGLFSRYPIVDVELQWTRGGRPFYNALIETPTGLVRVLGAHTAAPFDGKAAADRNANIKQLAMLAQESVEPVLLLGDLNVTMFSPHYEPLADAGLVNVRRGRGVGATWPAFSPVIPIDHVLHSADFAVCEVEVGESFDSDHLPLSAGLEFKSTRLGAFASR